jgi:Tol biopolymer transport system component
MIFARALVALAKPVAAVGVVGAAVTGAWFAIDRIGGDGTTQFQRVVADDAQHLLISEFGLHEDTIVAVQADDTSERREIATIDHAEGWGVFAALSPDGRAIAYTALPTDTQKPTPDSRAIAGIVEDNGDVQPLADDADLLITPVWSPESDAIVVRRNVPEEASAGSFELLLLGRDGSRAVLTAWQSAAIFPIAFTPDGSRFYFATLNASGSDLYSVARDGSDETLVAHLSDEISRDWTLSPDGATLAYSVALSGPRPALRTMLLDLSAGEAREAQSQSSAGWSQINPSWSPDGSLSVAALDAQGGGDAVVLNAAGERTGQYTDNIGAIDVPLAWSPDGATLAVRHVDGAATDTSGGRIDVIAADRSREPVSTSPDTLIVGWME